MSVAFWLALGTIAVWMIDARLGLPALILACFAAIIIGAHEGSAPPRSTPDVIRRLPTAYERDQARRSRWMPEIGIGLGWWHGIVPFVTLTFRRRR